MSCASAMEPVLSDPLLQFRPGAVRAVRALYGLDAPGRMEDAVRILDDWAKKQAHFKRKDFDPSFLEAIIISCKGSVERAKSRLDTYLTVRTMLPKFFDLTDVNDLKDKHKIAEMVVCPKTTEDYCRVFILKVNPVPFDGTDLFNFYQGAVCFCEYFRAHDYFDGAYLVFDYSEINLSNLLSALNPIDLSQSLSVFIGGYGLKVKGVHIITASKMVEVLMSMARQILSKKLNERIRVHKNRESLLEVLPKEILPAEYGGMERSIDELSSDWVKLLGSETHVTYMESLRDFTVDEDMRPKDKYNDEYMGMPGSFRTLTVD